MVNSTRKARNSAPKKTAFAQSLTATLTASKAVEDRLHSNLIADYGLKGTDFIEARNAVYEAWKGDQIKPEDIPQTMSLANPVCRYIFDALADGAIKSEHDRDIVKASTQEMKAKKFTPAMKEARENGQRDIRRRYNALRDNYILYLNPHRVKPATDATPRGKKESEFSPPERYFAMCWHASEKLLEKSVEGENVDQVTIDFSNTIKAACKAYAAKVTAMKALTSKLTAKTVVVKASLAKQKK